MSGIEGDAVGFGNSGVEGALHVVHALRDEVQGEFFVAVQVVEQTVGIVETVAESCVWWVGICGDAVDLPLVNVAVRDVGVIFPGCGVAGEVRNDGHCFDADDSLQGKVGLVG